MSTFVFQRSHNNHVLMMLYMLYLHVFLKVIVLNVLLWIFHGSEIGTTLLTCQLPTG